MQRYAVTATYGNRKRSIQKRFSDLRQKRARPKKYRTTTLGKLLFITQYRMRYAIYIPPNAEDPTIDLTMLAYGIRQKAIKLRALKHFMKTKL